MNELRKKFWSFIRLLIKRWVLWLIYYGGLLSAIFTFRILKIEIPSYVFWIIAFIGLFWASFKVYKELVDKIPIHDIDLKKKPKISIELFEGNQYTYTLAKDINTFDDIEKDEKTPLVPRAFLKLNIRISNKEMIELDILSIDVGYDEYGSPFDFGAPDEPKYRDAEEIKFPLNLGLDGVFLCEIQNIVRKHIVLNNAQFAARLAHIDKDKPYIKAEINVEARGPTGKIYKFPFFYKVTTRPLVDLYISKWQREGRTNLLRLAHSESKIIKETTTENETPQKK